MQNKGHVVNSFNTKRSNEILCAKIKINSIVNENAANSEGFLMHYEGRPRIICSKSFSNCKVYHKKTVAFSQLFNHVQLHVHRMYLLNNRICKYTNITPTI